MGPKTGVRTRRSELATTLTHDSRQYRASLLAALLWRTQPVKANITKFVGAAVAGRRALIEWGIET